VTQFEFLTVFISIVLAFGVSDILSSWGEQIRLRKQVRVYWLHVAWSALLLTLMIQVWWSLWVLRDRTEWTFIEYLVMIVPFLTVSLIAYLMTPSLRNDDRDIKRHYWDNSRWMFSLAAVYMFFAMGFSFVIVGDDLLELRNTIRVGALILMVALAVWQNEKFHAMAAIVAGALLVSWIGVTAFTL
jgi:hypothetical protein